MKRLNLMGQVFGRLTVVGEAAVIQSGRKKVFWLCRCECGNERVVQSSNLRTGHTTSCGCSKETRDMSGQRFSRLVVVRRNGTSKHGQTMWLCRCDCGETRSVSTHGLNSGQSKSCGCLQREVARFTARSRIKHGHNRASSGPSATYISWAAMIQRCGNPDNPKYPEYGGRGITVCDRWKSFESFLSDMGERPAGLTIDRINNDGGYEPGNCRWATPLTQARNRRKRRREAA